VVLGPDLGALDELIPVTVDGNDADQLTAGDLQRSTVKPPRDFDSTKINQPTSLSVDVVGLDVQVVARHAIDGLHGCNQAWYRIRQIDKLFLIRNRLRLDPQGCGPESH
jgi:hypothetical protein